MIRSGRLYERIVVHDHLIGGFASGAAEDKLDILAAAFLDRLQNSGHYVVILAEYRMNRRILLDVGFHQFQTLLGGPVGEVVVPSAGKVDERGLFGHFIKECIHAFAINDDRHTAHGDISGQPIRFHEVAHEDSAHLAHLAVVAGKVHIPE